MNSTIECCLKLPRSNCFVMRILNSGRESAQFMSLGSELLHRFDSGYDLFCRDRCLRMQCLHLCLALPQRSSKMPRCQQDRRQRRHGDKRQRSGGLEQHGRCTRRHDRTTQRRHGLRRHGRLDELRVGREARKDVPRRRGIEVGRVLGHGGREEPAAKSGHDPVSRRCEEERSSVHPAPRDGGQAEQSQRDGGGGEFGDGRVARGEDGRINHSARNERE
mmetsp:Transcript_47377/g.143437  ORF Transcript_47377/g.143437 Transcript_47377/m.143437 type:complete len:219 (-) Transcript_47377:367-1023(-)